MTFARVLAIPRMKRFAVVSAAVIVGALLLAAPRVQPAPVPKPTLAVELWPAEQALNASYEVREVTISGRMTLGNAPYAKYEVFLDACIDQGWAASCTPDYVTFWGDGASDFKISVTVPQLATDRTARIWVESRATYEDVDVAGNVSAPVYLTVGKLPGTGTDGGGGTFLSPVSGGSGPPAVMLVAVAIFLVIGFILGFVVWRWKGRRKRRSEQVNK